MSILTIFSKKKEKFYLLSEANGNFANRTV